MTRDAAALRSERALVLGGGGSTGNAWQSGIAAGLLAEGVDIAAADLTIGTSAGSTTAVQLAGRSATELLAAVLTQDLRGASGGGSQPRPPGEVARSHLAEFKRVITESDDIDDLRRKMGQAALAVDPEADAAWQAQWRATVASRLPIAHWPKRRLRLTAVDARTGIPVVFDRESGVDLVDAVAASCAGGRFAYRIGEGRYIDGGYRAYAENADLASGSQRVLVLSPLGGRSLYPLEWGTHLATHVEQLRVAGHEVVTVFPTTESAPLFVNPMDYSMRAAAARAGQDQGMRMAAGLHAFWQRGPSAAVPVQSHSDPSGLPG